MKRHGDTADFGLDFENGYRSSKKYRQICTSRMVEVLSRMVEVVEMRIEHLGGGGGGRSGTTWLP